MTKRPLVLLALMVVLMDFGLTHLGVIHPGEYYVEGDKVEIRGTIYSKQQKDGYNVFYLRDAYDRDRKIGRVVLYEYLEENTHKGSYEIPISARVSVQGSVLAMRRAENEGSFDERSYLVSKGIFTKVSAAYIRILEMPYFSVSNYLFELRDRIVDVYEKSLPGEEAGILSTMALGDRSILSSDAGDLFSDAGLSHIFAISGMHISIIGMGILSILSSFFKRNKAVVISSVFVILYAIMVGGSVSAVRAVGMFIIMLFAFVCNEAYDSLSAMSLMAIIILLRNPFSLLDVSFIFSFGVVLCLILLANPAADYYTRYCRLRWEKCHRTDHGRKFRIRFHQRIVRELLRGLVLQIASLPMVAFCYFVIPTYVIILNMILIPLLGLVLGVGLVGGFVGLISVKIAGIILSVCHYIIYIYEFLADVSLRLPYSRLTVGRPGIWQVLIYYIILLLCSFLLLRRVDEMKRQKGNDADIREWHPIHTLKVCMILAALLLIINYRFNKFEVVMLSVGQGDGIFLDSGMGKRFFIDGGSTSNDEVGKYVMEPFLRSRGVDRIDGWFLSHMDLDHISGFTELLESGYRVERLYLAKGIEPGEQLEKIKGLCSKYNVDIIYTMPGDTVSCHGKRRDSDSLEIECIAPEYPSEFSGPNENSQVLCLRYYDGSGEEFDGIFTGDIGEEQEEAILEGTYGNRLKELGSKGELEILKSAHHGSNSSNCQRFLEVLNPNMIIISAGKNNRYHHPGRETVARMDDLDLEHLCTIDTGQITVRMENGKVMVFVFLCDQSHQ